MSCDDSPQPGPWHRIPLPSSGLVCTKGQAGGVVIVLLMYVVIAALSTLAMAALARHASTYQFGVRYPYP
jgi:hypothetical protein